MRRFVPFLVMAAVLALGPLRAAQPASAEDQVLVVTSAGDDSADGCDATECTLREAIEEANATSGPATIRFAIPGDGVHTISPSTELPAITDELTIDGYSQPGAKPATASADATLLVEVSMGQPIGLDNGLTVAASNSTVMGLVINGFTNEILVQSPGNVLTNITIAGNYLGVDARGKVTKGQPGTAGVIVGPDRGGITSHVTIGGTTPAARNVIGNHAFGVALFLLETEGGNTIAGNYIGVTSSGTQVLSGYPGAGGVVIAGTHGARIGGRTAAERNVIGGQEDAGILFSDAFDAVVEGNYIGIGADGHTPVGNQSGIRLEASAGPTTIGGRTASAANTIAHNSKFGIVLEFDTNTVVGGLGNSILHNSIYENGDLGIDLGEDGVTANDPTDADDGPNHLQNTPVLTSAQVTSTRTVVNGRLQSAPSGTYLLQFFGNPRDDPGQGRTFLGQLRVTTGGDGTVEFSKLAHRVSTGDSVTATATNVTRNLVQKESKDTSEFSVPVTAKGSGGGSSSPGGKHRHKHHKHGKHGHR